MALLQLNHGYAAILDDDLIDSCMAMGPWRAVIFPRTVYAWISGRRTHKNVRPLYLHRWVMGEPTGVRVDHRDGNGLNCQRSNLREATRSQNNANSVIIKSKAGLRGVTLTREGRFQARVHFLGKEITLGTFATPEEASFLYEEKRRELFGEFAPNGR